MYSFSTLKNKISLQKIALITLFSVLFISCSNNREVIITGQITGGSPLERIELIETSGIATLPITNMAVDAQGKFADTVQIPKNGVYVFTYGGKVGFLYLKGGDKVNISGTAQAFPEDLKITGDAKNNSEFLSESQKFTNSYLRKLNEQVFAKDEKTFIKELEKYKADISKKNEEIAKAKKPDSDVVKLNKDELDITILMITSQYQNFHGQATNNPAYKPTAVLRDFQKSLEKENYVKDMPTYRNYLLNNLSADFQKFAQPLMNEQTPTTEILAKFLDTKKEYNQLTKDYLLAFVATQYDLQPNNPNKEKTMKVLNEKIKSAEIKKDLKKVEEAIFGLAVGTVLPDVNLVKADGKSAKLTDFKGKPNLIMFYASWNPYLQESVMPVVKEMVNFYQSKMNFTFLNVDDTHAQFVKTSKSLFPEIKGNHLYAPKGLNSDAAQKFALYGFKLPSFVVVDKDGKIVSRVFFNVADAEFVDILNKQTGLSAPVQQQMPEITPEMLQQMQQMQEQQPKSK